MSRSAMVASVADAVGRLLAEVGVPFATAVGAVLTFVVVLLAVYVLGRFVVLPLVDRVMNASDLHRHAKRPIRKIVWAAVLFSAFAIAFGLAGFGDILLSLATIGAAATLAVGFAMQDVIRNFAAGVFIFADRPFRIGDWIEWDEYAGVVQDISLRVTRVQTFDNELLTVPNAELAGGVVKNPVANDRLRLRFTFGIGYDDDVERAGEIIVSAAEDHPDILDDPAPSVLLTELGDDSVGLESRFWIADPTRADFLRIRGEYVNSVKSRFDEAGIDIPYPQRVLHGAVALSESHGMAPVGADAETEE